jgi:hypothetical protein
MIILRYHIIQVELSAFFLAGSDLFYFCSTLQLQFIDQPPEKCVYKRNVKPPPVLMVSGEQGPNDGNLYIIVNLIRCDTFQEAPTLLTGNKPVK